jgi:hypothetical protein
MVASFVKAISLYRESKYGESKPCVLFVVDYQERNFAEKNKIEAALQFKHGISLIRVIFTDIGQEINIYFKNTLHVRSKEIGLVYYLIGYQINKYDYISGVMHGRHAPIWKIRWQ